MVVEEIWGVSLERAQRFLADQPDVAPKDSGFACSGCQIRLARQAPGQMGAVPFPRTLLRIEGPEPEVKAIHRRFLIQFLSAGG